MPLSAPPSVPPRDGDVSPPPSQISGRSGPIEGPLHKVPPRHPHLAAAGGSPNDSSEFPSHMFGQPSSVFVYGTSRPLVNLTLYALATHTNPEFQWVEIGALSEDRMPCDPVRLGWIPGSRLWVIDRPKELRPGADHLPIHDLIRSDEPEEVLGHFSDFLRLPDTSQRILTATSPERPGVVAVTNAQRVQQSFPFEVVPSILNVHRRSGYSVIIGFGEHPGAGRDVFDFVFRLQGQDLEKKDWKGMELVCEKGIDSGPLKESRPVRLDQIPLIANVVSEARSTP